MSVPNFPSIRQVHSTICWAACIEMVARFLHAPTEFDNYPPTDLPLQRRILKEYYSIKGNLNENQPMLTSFCSIGDGYPSLKPEKKYYQEILKKVFGISAKQRFQDNVPTFLTLKRHTDVGKPVILGMKYPGIINGNHAAVVIDCQISGGVKLLSVIDPFANHNSSDICSQNNGIVAYLDYDSLQRRNGTDASVVSVTSNFLKMTVASRSIALSTKPDPEIFDLPNTGGIEEIRNMVMALFLEESIFRVKLENLKVRDAVIVSRYQTLTEFLDQKPAEELRLLKVLTGKKDSLEIMIEEKPATASEPASYEFVGIRESYFTDQNVSSVKLRFGGRGTGRKVNHFEPNYTLLHLQPGDLTFMVFKLDDESCYVSLSDMPSIGIHYKEPYSFEELSEIVWKAFPRYIDQEKFSSN